MSTITLTEHQTAHTGSLEPVESDLRVALQAKLDELLDRSRPLDVLDAGCGYRMPVPIADDLRVTGIDIDAAQLRPDLDEAIVGDLQTTELGRDRFDVVICWNVLEHIADPMVVISKFVDALRPGGVVVLGLPHVASVKGLVTKYSPQWFHAWVWTHLLGAGPGHEEFPTVLSRSLKPARLRRYAADNGLTVQYLAEYESWAQKRVRRRLKLSGRTFAMLARLVQIMSLGSVTVAHTDMMIVVQKPKPSR
jgi:2-polyprenyl-3-methyl-5-hydroxy-6-metoxy-1,4-benzoquinol methylase